MSENDNERKHPFPDLDKLAEIPPAEGTEPGFQERGTSIPEILPILPMADLNLFPRMVFPLLILDSGLGSVVQESLQKDRILALFNLKDPEGQKSPVQGQDLHHVGLAAYVLKMAPMAEQGVNILVQGLSRIRLLEVVQTDPYLTGRVESIEEEAVKDKETEALMAQLRGLFQRFLDLSPNVPQELAVMNRNVTHPGLLADLVASSLNVKAASKQILIDTVDVKARLELVLVMLQEQLEILELGSKLQSQIKGRMDKTQRDYYLREQMKAIQDELGHKDEAAQEIEDLELRIAEKGLPEEARIACLREAERLGRMSPSSPEYSVARTYIDWILDLPWLTFTQDVLDIDQAQAILDQDHFGLEKIKKRIIEYLAVRKLKADMKGPILCFVGPPGTGKTSLGRSIARATGRKFVRMSLGGIRDEAEIRGHRRTYVGALPGRIIQGLKKAGSSNPVFVLDEVDKLVADFRGDPSSALLEVLDPEQNFSFSDHYLAVDYDLSQVMFIATANVLDQVPGPLRDRMEVLSLSGYTNEEKLIIAKRYLVPRQREANGLTAKNILIRDGAIKKIISEYTREAGLRNLEREIGAVCRSVATEVAKGLTEKKTVRVEDVTEILGPARFENEVRARTSQAGVATGLAWTPSGGDILFIEATSMPGKGGLLLTGQLGEVMKESAQAALSYVKSRSETLGVAPAFFSQHDLHVHVPAGAIPKDGPSAGVTLVSALASLATGRPVRPEVAMTGEITLRGLVLPVGGIKEKVLAAKRAGIKEVILPRRNDKDLEDIPDSFLTGMSFHLAETMDQVLDLALKPAK